MASRHQTTPVAAAGILLLKHRLTPLLAYYYRHNLMQTIAFLFTSKAMQN